MKASLEDSHKDYEGGEYSSVEDHQPRDGLWSSCYNDFSNYPFFQVLSLAISVICFRETIEELNSPRIE